VADNAKLTEQQLRGEEARMLLEHPLFQAAFEAVEQQMVDAWKSSYGEESAIRERAYLMQRLNVNLKQFFVTHISNGKAAARELLTLKDPSKIARLIGNG